MDELKPCPFCGGKVTLYKVSAGPGGDDGYWAIECTGHSKLHFSGVHGEERERVISEWNLRLYSPSVETMIMAKALAIVDSALDTVAQPGTKNAELLREMQQLNDLIGGKK